MNSTGNSTDLLHEFNCVLNNVSCSIGGLRSALDAFGFVANKIENRISELREIERGITLRKAELDRREEQIKSREFEVVQREKVGKRISDNTKVSSNASKVDKINLNVGMQ
jgi:hypothetical protein